MQAYILNAH